MIVLKSGLEKECCASKEDSDYINMYLLKLYLLCNIHAASVNQQKTY